MTRVNYIKCDVCGRTDHGDEVWLREGHPGSIGWVRLGQGKHACSVECYIKANPITAVRNRCRRPLVKP